MKNLVKSKTLSLKPLVCNFVLLFICC